MEIAITSGNSASDSSIAVTASKGPKAATATVAIKTAASKTPGMKTAAAFPGGLSKALAIVFSPTGVIIAVLAGIAGLEFWMARRDARKISDY